jgi:hypothetical protein
MLHAEPFPCSSPGQFVQLQSRYKQLRRHGSKQLEQPFPMFAIKLRGRVIDQQHHFSLIRLDHKVRLCDYQRASQKFLLAAGDVVTECVASCLEA